MDNTLRYERGNCGSIPYGGTKLRIATAKIKILLLMEKDAILFYYTPVV